MPESIQFILAARAADGTFIPQEISHTKEDLWVSLEYGDVREHEYQLWEYPSGRIMWIDPDRKVDEKDYYTTPYSKNGAIWLPKLNEIGINEAGVREAYEGLVG
jgi:hypothetical protein